VDQGRLHILNQLVLPLYVSDNLGGTSFRMGPVKLNM
jgi:hypothetical protein